MRLTAVFAFLSSVALPALVAAVPVPGYGNAWSQRAYDDLLTREFDELVARAQHPGPHGLVQQTKPVWTAHAEAHDASAIAHAEGQLAKDYRLLHQDEQRLIADGHRPRDVLDELMARALSHSPEYIPAYRSSSSPSRFSTSWGHRSDSEIVAREQSIFRRTATAAQTKAALTRIKAAHGGKLPKPSFGAVVAAGHDVAQHLNARGVPYYFCGGFACVYLAESQRTTGDIDIVAKDGHSYVQLQDVVKAMPNVVDDPATKDPVYYNQATDEFVEMDLLLAGLGAGFPKWEDHGFELQTKDTIAFLAPSQLLKIKFRSWNDASRRTQAAKHEGDRTDILGLRKHIRYTLDTKVDKSGWDSQAKAALAAWITQYNDAADWRAIGL